MRLDDLTVQRYGPLDGLELDGLAASPVVVVLGPNESGKSTLRELLTTLLFGFSPASGAKHPLVRRGLELSVHARFLTGADGPLEVSRTLGATARGQLSFAGNTSTLRNEGLPQAIHLSREVYEGLASVDAASLRTLEERDGWRLAQERLLGGAHAEGLIPASQALSGLRARREGIWRPDRRRANVRVRELEAELKRHRTIVREAAEERRDAGVLIARQAEQAEQLDALRTEAERLARLAHVLHPVATSMAFIETRTRQADELCNGNEAALGATPSATVEAARVALDRAREAATAAHVAAREAKADATPSAGSVRDAELTEILTAVERSAEEAARRERDAASAHDALRQARSLRNEAALVVAASPEDESDLASFARLDPQAVHATRAPAVERPVAGSGAAPAAVRPASLLIAGGAVLVALVLTLAGAATLAVVAVAAIGLAAIVFALLSTRLIVTPSPSSRLLAEDQVGRERAFQAATPGAAIHPDRLAVIDAALVDDVVRLIGRQREYERAVEREREAARSSEAARDLVAGLLTEAGVPNRDELRERVRSGRVALAAAEKHAARLPEREAAAAQAGEEAARRDAELARLLALAAGLAPSGDPGEGVARAERALALRRTVDEERTRITGRFSELEELQLEATRALEAGELRIEDGSSELHAARASELADRREAMSAEHAATGARLQAIQAGPGVADAAGAVAALESQLADAKREHDRLALVEAIIRAADVELRRSRRPRFLSRASELVSAITGGAIEELDVADSAKGGPPELVLRRHERDAFERVEPPVSLGTLQQIHLAVRLALIDELDPQRLPLVLDEALVHWDEARLAGFLQLLHAIDDRQVIVTTCHAWLAEAIEGACAARLVHLPSDVPSARDQARAVAMTE